MCALYEVTRAGYYAWRSREESAHQGQDRVLLEEIAATFAASGRTYGSPRVQRSLVELYSRRLLGWSLAPTRGADLPRAAFEHALKHRRPQAASTPPPRFASGSSSSAYARA